MTNLSCFFFEKSDAPCGTDYDAALIVGKRSNKKPLSAGIVANFQNVARGRLLVRGAG